MSILSTVASAAINNSETLIVISNYARMELIMHIRKKKSSRYFLNSEIISKIKFNIKFIIVEAKSSAIAMVHIYRNLKIKFRIMQR